ncbi:MAG: hypothetical protein DHS20C15_05360 [Planctomycetota bacterium]|nr:MAG: hypothetical protein DHS20C15_05360 [Planctomycetota bacterium]
MPRLSTVAALAVLLLACTPGRSVAQDEGAAEPAAAAASKSTDAGDAASTNAAAPASPNAADAANPNVAAAAAAADDDAASQSFEFQPGDTIALVGGALAERMQHHGWLETRLQARLPELGLTFRNLGFAGDELTVQQRVQGFGSADEHLTRVAADVIFAFWGFNESFAGEAGLPKFRADLAAYIEHTRAQRYNGESAPRLVLFSPAKFEDTKDPLLPERAAENARLGHYAAAMRDVAVEAGVPFVDLLGLSVYDQTNPTVSVEVNERLVGAFAPRPPGSTPRRRTLDGMQRTSDGNSFLAMVIDSALLDSESKSTGEEWRNAHDRVRPLVLEKNRLWFNRYRATDGYNVYGGRSGLTYDGVTNYEVLQHELVVIDAMCANLDCEIHAAARGEPAPEPLPVPALMTVETNRPGPNPDGSYGFVSGDDAIASMTAAPGMTVELFADESMFPLLRNPVQMSWDTQGRLWVATWPTYPHWTPGEPMDDALLVLEDTDGDGRADTCTPFADDLHNPTGFEFFDGGVFVANPPDILYLKDTDGDGRADSRERVLGGLSSGDTHHSANSFVLGPGGALYFQEGIFHQSQVETVHGPVRNNDGAVWRYEPRTARVQRYVPYGFLNPHGHVFDRWGQDFVTDGTGNTNYYVTPFSGHVEQGRKHGGYFPFFQQRSRPAAATEILSSSHFPAENQGNYLIANVIGFQGIFQYALHDDGSGFGATEVEPLVHSSDPNFRPVDIEVGPDGAVYFLDWQNPLIGHMQHHLRDPNRDQGHGRIYRVRMADRELLTPPPIAGRPIPELLSLLHSPDDRVRYRVRIELSGRERGAVIGAVKRWVKELPSQDVEQEHALLEALWVLQSQASVDEQLLRRVLASPEARARAAAVRVLRWMRREVDEALGKLGWMRSQRDDALDLLARAVADDHPRVRLEAVVALSEFENPRAAELAVRVLGQSMDRFLDYALKETVATLAPYWRAALVAPTPFAADDPVGLAYLLKDLSHEDLVRVTPRSAAVSRELLSRHTTVPTLLAPQIRLLGAASGRGAAQVWIDAVRAADARRGAHVDHLLVNLFDALDHLPRELLAGLHDEVAELARDGARASTRRLATAGRMRASGSAEPAWTEASASLAELTALLDAAPMVRSKTVARELFPKVAALLHALPPELAAQADAQPGVVGRTIRIELPGASRTLTLAEVEVFSGSENIAPRGTATQSTTNWGGVAARAVDGNTSGVYGDNGQTHTREDQPDTWWQLELPSAEPIDRIVIWNRTESDGQWVSRLDGFVITVLDDAGRSVFRSAPQPATARAATLQLTPPLLQLRRAAIGCLAALDVHPDQAVFELLAQFDDPELRDAVVEALSRIPPEQWRAADLERAAAMLHARFTSEPAESFHSFAGRRELNLADRLAPVLRADLAGPLLRTRRRLGPQVIVIRPVPDTLTYDLSAFTVQAGRPVELLFENTDIMPHNLLISTPGSLADVGQAGEAMAAEADAWERAFVPDLDQVLWTTGLLQPGDQELLAFTAPQANGEYPYLCTFPGHWIRMNGVMHVVDELPEGALVVRRDAVVNPRTRTARPELPSSVVAEGAVSAGASGAASGDAAGGGADVTGDANAQHAPRKFVRNWTVSDFDNVLDEVAEAYLPLGRWVAEEAGCLRCHSVADEAGGAQTGPAFSQIASRGQRRELLTAILDPSDSILEGYESETLFLKSGRVVSGRVFSENGDGVMVLSDPYSDKPEFVPAASIDERRKSTVSVMPEGLLSTFEPEDVLALLAYLESVQR